AHNHTTRRSHPVIDSGLLSRESDSVPGPVQAALFDSLHSSSKTPAHGVFFAEATYLFYLTSRHPFGVFSFESIRVGRVVIGFALYAAGLVLAFAPVNSAAAEDNAAAELNQSVPAHALGEWRATGDLNTARHSHTATLLRNGRVLVSGGDSTHGSLAFSQLYKSAPEELDIQ